DGNAGWPALLATPRPFSRTRRWRRASTRSSRTCRPDEEQWPTRARSQRDESTRRRCASYKREPNRPGGNGMSKKLEGKVAVGTGASKGRGASIARALADEGASVVVNYSSSKDAAQRVVTEISARGGRAIAVQADVSKSAEIEPLLSEAKRSFDRIDILVNN